VAGLTDVINDCKAAFDRLLRAQDADEQRRALHDALENLYALRCYREGETKASRTAYWQRAGACRSGRVTEGVILLRGEMMHNITKWHAPQGPAPRKKPLYPGPNTYPGNFTFPGSNLTWLHPTEMRDPLSPKVLGDSRYPAYMADVAGRPVLETLHTAREFLVNDPGPLP
jgi:hypothetical protein